MLLLVEGFVLLKCPPAEMCLAIPAAEELILTVELRNWIHRFAVQTSVPQILIHLAAEELLSVTVREVVRADYLHLTFPEIAVAAVVTVAGPKCLR